MTTTYYISTGEHRIEVEAEDRDEAIDAAVKQMMASGGALGLLTVCSTHGFGEYHGDDWLISTEVVLKRNGFRVVKRPA